jgi:hypothetical protein
MTRRLVVPLVVVAALAVGIAAAPKVDGRKGVLAPLEVGQQVSLKESAGGFTISVVQGVPLGQKVVEVGAEYVVLEDPTGTVQTRVPITSVRAVVVTRLPKEK